MTTYNKVLPLQKEHCCVGGQTCCTLLYKSGNLVVGVGVFVLWETVNDYALLKCLSQLPDLKSFWIYVKKGSLYLLSRMYHLTKVIWITFPNSAADESGHLKIDIADKHCHYHVEESDIELSGGKE